MMSIYYFAKQVYQFSNAMPLYKKIDGKFLISSKNRNFQFQLYFRNGNFTKGHKSFLNTPPHIIRTKETLNDLKGVIISLSNVLLNNNPDQTKTIFIGHGTGDKRYPRPEYLKIYDYHFLSGPKHLEKLKDDGLNIPEEKLIKIGNLRFDDYINGKIDKEKEMSRLGIKDRSRKNILYAPTWKRGNGTLQKYATKFAQEITKEHNLIIRPHANERHNIVRLKLWATLNNIKHVYFSNPTAVIKSDTLNDFKVSDILISDTSSILYEYLITGNPIIVIQNQFDKLHEMPDQLNIMKHVTLYDGSKHILKLINTLLNTTNSTHIYKELLDDCFYYNDGKAVDRAKEFILSIS